MTSKEALKDILGILINNKRLSDIHDNQEKKKKKFGIIEKDLDLFEEYRKIKKIIYKWLKICYNNNVKKRGKKLWVNITIQQF